MPKNSLQDPHEAHPTSFRTREPHERLPSPSELVCQLGQPSATFPTVVVETSFHSPVTDLQSLRLSNTKEEPRFRDNLAVVSSPDPQLSKKFTNRLKRSLTKLAHRVPTSRVAFDAVDCAIGQVSTDDHQREALAAEWQTIRDSFEEELRNSSAAAIRGHTAIRNFLSVVVPYLLQISILSEEKVKVLALFQESMTKGQMQARDVSRAFNDISSSISAFKRKCANYNDGALLVMERVTTELEREVRGLTESIREVAINLSRLKPIWRTTKALEKRQLVAVVDDSLRSAGKEKRLKERQLHSRRRESQEAKRLDAELQNQTNTLQSDMKGFAEIWNMIEDDICSITQQLNLIAVNGSLPQLFYHRLSFLPGQYAGLMEALDLYVSALSAGKVEFRALEWLPQRLKTFAKTCKVV